MTDLCRRRPRRDLSEADPARDREGAARDRCPCEEIHRDVAVLRARDVRRRRQRRCLAARRQSRLRPCRRPEPAADAGPFRQQPDRQFRNIVEGSGFVQLISSCPGIDETLRVGGTRQAVGRSGSARLDGGVRQAAARGAERRCQRSLFPLRQGADALKAVGAGEVQRSVMPSISQVIHDQTSLGEPESQAVVEARYKTQL